MKKSKLNEENEKDLKKYKKYYVLDTNIILDDAKSIIKLSDKSENLIIIPETVLDEIDSKKSGFNEINFQAREFARMLSHSQVLKKRKTKNGLTIVSVLLNNNLNIHIDIISKENYSFLDKKFDHSIINDRKIIEIALDVNKLYSKKIRFLSLDIMARIRAFSFGLKVETLIGNDDGKILNNDIFFKTITLDKDLTYEELQNKNIKDFDENYEQNNYSYYFTCPLGNKYLTVIQNEKIKIIDEKYLRQQYVSPKNREQLLFSNAILDDYYNIVISNAKAGSGKTLLSISSGLELIKKKKYSKLIYIRNSVESIDKGEDVGYLSGNDAKFSIYNHPLYDTLDYIARKEIEKSQNNKSKANKINDDFIENSIETKIEEMVSNFNISTMWVGELRGRTITNAVVIIDETQNMSNKTILTALTRLDSSCKIIVVGSIKQIDNFYLNKHTNSLNTLLNATKIKTENENINLFSIELNKVLRGPITEWAETVLEQ